MSTAIAFCLGLLIGVVAMGILSAGAYERGYEDAADWYKDWNKEQDNESMPDM